MKVKKGDQVQIISGKNKGKRGKVLRVFASAQKALIENLNLVKKHVRPKKSGEKGQRVEIPAPLRFEKMLLVCPSCGKATRVGFSVKNDTKSRVCKKCNAEI